MPLIFCFRSQYFCFYNLGSYCDPAGSADLPVETDDSQRNYTSGTALSYLTEKLRQNDREDGIFLDELDGTQTVVLRQKTADASYLTYLYAWDGQLRELYVKEGTTFSPSAGKSILPVKEFSMEETENQVITFRCTDTSGETATAVYTIRSVSR